MGLAGKGDALEVLREKFAEILDAAEGAEEILIEAAHVDPGMYVVVTTPEVVYTLAIGQVERRRRPVIVHTRVK